MDVLKKLTHKIELNLLWPLIVCGVMALMNIGLYFIDGHAGFYMTVCVLVTAAATLIFYFVRRDGIHRDLAAFAEDYVGTQKELLQELEIPYIMAEDNGRILWMNPAFRKAIGRNGARNLKDLFPELKKKKVFPAQMSASYPVTLSDRHFQLNLHMLKENLSRVDEVDAENEESEETAETETTGQTRLIMASLNDVTYRVEYEQKLDRQKPVVGLIYVDNYDETLESVEDVKRSLLLALIDRRINKFISNVGGLMRKTENDKYFVVLQKEALLKLKENGFSVLDEVKSVNIGNDVSATLSIGFGTGGNGLTPNYEYARTAIDMALGRGGDQVVIKDGASITYFGGKSEQTGKTTRVRAREKAHALEEIIDSKDRIIVMGHRNADVDSFGAAVGVCRICRELEKEAHVLLENEPAALLPVLDRFRGNADYEEEFIINKAQAAELSDENTLLVLVDCNRPSYSECPEAFDWLPNVVVIDHHRRMTDSVENAVLSYVEPYASSACEMVCEILQYIHDGIRLKNVEADTMYAGMMVDTNNFMNHTGVRTFEAAAFLRRNGADVTRVRKMFRDNMDDSKAKAKVIAEAEVFENGFCIGVCDAEGLESPTITAAQAANDMLNIVGVRAGFVLCEYQDQVFISARSIDEVNVQLIMERMGGGGHLSMAGAQLKNATVDEAKQKLKETLLLMITEGAI